jgi:predicted enzyme related to lactoylglutathione lyase
MPEFASYPPGTPSWVDIQSPDIPATIAFYTELFGWGVQELGPEAGGYALFTKDGKQVAGVGSQMMAGAPSAWVTYVATDDIAASTKTASEAGATVFAEPMAVFDSGSLAVFADPVGGVFALWQAGSHTGAQLANEPGTFVWSELHTRDTEASAAFYGALFGWKGKTEDFGGTPYTQWMLGDHEVGGMMPMPEAIPPEVGAYWVTYFAVVDADATVAKAGELGGTTTMPATDTPVGRLGFIADPHGVTFAIIQMPTAA